MIITCKTFDDFLVNLKHLPTNDRLLEGMLRFSISEMDETGDGVKFIINFQASAIVWLADREGQYLLELGVDVGRDIRDSDPDLTGTKCALEYKAVLEELCKTRGWTILPGVISI